MPALTWINGINLVLGLWILIAPWALGYAGVTNGAAANDSIVGFVIVTVAAIRIAYARRPTVVGPPRRY